MILTLPVRYIFETAINFQAARVAQIGARRTVDTMIGGSIPVSAEGLFGIAIFFSK